MKGYKKILAGVLATSMVMGSSVVVLADEGRTTGSGKVEGSTSDKVFRVELPTIAENDDTFNYIIDPLELIKEAGADRYGALTFESGASVFFHNDNKNTTIAKDYASESAPLTVRNFSTDPVDLTVTVKATEVEGITLTDDAAFTNDKSTSLYLALQGAKADDTDDSTNVDGIGSTGTAQITKQLAKIGVGASGKDPYVIKWNPIRDQYEYVEDTTVTDAVVDKYSFKLVGKCNPIDATGSAATGSSRANWLEVLESGKTPELELIWTVQNPFEVTIKLEKDLTDATKTNLTMSNFTGEKNFESVSIDDGTDVIEVASDVTWNTGNWDDENGGEVVAVLNNVWTDWMSGKLVTVKVSLTDGSVKTVSVQAP